MPRLWTPSDPEPWPRKPKPVLRMAGLRNLFVPNFSAAPLGNEVDYDDLVIHRAWRTHEESRPNEVRYFNYELDQRDVGERSHTHFFKAVRFLRVTAVPRHLRQVQNGGAEVMFEQQRDLLAALRARGILFTQIITKTAETPLIFAWGVQATGDTIEEARAEADVAYAVLEAQVNGTYEQLRYKPLSLEEGESLGQIQAEWRHIVMARGRPEPTVASMGAAAELDGNRTDLAATNNQLESFIRGMADKHFLLTLTSVPVTPEEMGKAWYSITRKLSDVRSSQQGSRTFAAAVAMPLVMGSSLGVTDGSGHTSSAGHGSSHTDSSTAGTSHTDSESATVGRTDTTGVTHTVGTTDTVGASHGTNVSNSINHVTSLGHGVNQTDSQTVSEGDAISAGHTTTQGWNEGVNESVSQSEGRNASLSQSESTGVTRTDSLGQTVTEGRNWSNSITDGRTSSLTSTNGWNSSGTLGLSQTFGLNSSNGENIGNGQSSSESGGASGSLFGGGLGMQSGGGSSYDQGASHGHGTNSSLTGSGSRTEGVSGSLANSLGRTTTLGETVGGSDSVANSATRSVGTTHTQGLTATEGVSSSETRSLGRSAGISGSEADSQSRTLSSGLSNSTALGRSLNLSQAAGDSQSAGESSSVSASHATSQSTAGSVSRADAQSYSRGISDGVNRANSAADSTNVSSSDSSSTSLARALQTSGSLGIAPSVSAGITKMTFDEGKRSIGDMIEAQKARFQSGVKGGAYMYQLALTAPDPETLEAGASLLVSAFWGEGKEGSLTPFAFHTLDIDDEAETRRLLTHAGTFSPFRRRDHDIQNIEPWRYSSYVTLGEFAALSHAPVIEAEGIQNVVDSMPMFSYPSDRQGRELYLGHVIWGGRGTVTNTRYGLDTAENTHALIAGATGTGKTTALLRFAAGVVNSSKTVTEVDPKNPLNIRERKIRGSLLALDWKRDLRNMLTFLAPDEIEERFKFFNLADPSQGRFRFNICALPDMAMSPYQWIATIADTHMTAYSMGEFGRSLIYEALLELYTANRLEPYELLAAETDSAGNIVREAFTLPPVDRNELLAIDPNAIVVDELGNQVANVFSCPELSRLVDMTHVAVWLTNQIAYAATPQGGAARGAGFRDRAQSLWRRLMVFAPGSGPFAELCACDPSISVRETLTVPDLVDPEKGLITVIEVGGLPVTGDRPFILGGVLQAVWHYAMHHGDGIFDQGGKGIGAYVLLEEAAELLGQQTEDDNHTAKARTALYDPIYRMGRSYGLHMVTVTQTPSALPPSILGSCSTVISLRLTHPADRNAVAGLFSWIQTAIGGQPREWRYLGDMAIGQAIVKLSAQADFRESALVHVLVDPVELGSISDQRLREIAIRSKR